MDCYVEDPGSLRLLSRNRHDQESSLKWPTGNVGCSGRRASVATLRQIEPNDMVITPGELGGAIGSINSRGPSRFVYAHAVYEVSDNPCRSPQRFVGRGRLDPASPRRTETV